MGLMAEQNIFRFIHFMYISNVPLFFFASYFILCLYSDLSIHFFIGGHWGCLQFGTIVNKVYIQDIYIQNTCGFFCIYLGVEWLDHMVAICL